MSRSNFAVKGMALLLPQRRVLSLRTTKVNVTIDLLVRICWATLLSLIARILRCCGPSLKLCESQKLRAREAAMKAERHGLSVGDQLVHRRDKFFHCRHTVLEIGAFLFR